MTAINDLADEQVEAARHWLARWVFSPLQGARLGDWLSALADAGFAVDPVYWPRALFTTATAAGTSALARIEDSRWGRAIEQTPVRPPLFVLGHHRSGTTHLWNLLAHNPSLAYPTVIEAVFPHTFLCFSGTARQGARLFAMKHRPQDNVRVEPEGPSGEEKALCAATFRSIQMANHFPRRQDAYAPYLTMRDASEADRARWCQAMDRFARKLTLRYGTDKTLVFRAPDHTAKIALLREVFPEARFVHIHRDPYKVFSSTRWLERATRPNFAYQRQDGVDLDGFILWRYRAMYDAFFEDVEALPQGVFTEVSFDEVLADPLATVRRIHEDLGLDGWSRTEPALREYTASLEDYQRNTYADLEPEMRQRVAQEWHPSFERWGYPK